MARPATIKSRRKRTEAQISYNMSQIRSTGSKIERIMENALRSAGLKAKKQPSIFGKPDFAFLAERVAIFCDSHFWHGYRWKQKQKELKRNRKFWVKKIESNMKRDRVVNRTLRTSGWKVIRLWENQILHSVDKCVREIANTLHQRQ